MNASSSPVVTSRSPEKSLSRRTSSASNRRSTEIPSSLPVLTPTSYSWSTSEVITLNVGGQRISTTRQTLLSIPETFFTSLISGRIPSLRDNTGAVFIDRDPVLFNIILNFLRTRQTPVVDETTLDALRHESEFYGITPLSVRLDLVHQQLKKDVCGGVLFQGHLKCTKDREVSSSPGLESKGDAVIQIVAHHNSVAVARPHYVTCYRLKDSLGWQKVFETDRFSKGITRIAFCYSCGNISISPQIMLGIVQDRERYIKLISAKITGQGRAEVVKDMGRFLLHSDSTDALFFIGPRMVALGFAQGRVGVWHGGSPPWLEQALSPEPHHVITAYDKVDCLKYCNYLLLGSHRGCLFLIDMHKFPLRMKDGDLLINQLYEDPDKEEITAISCYLTRPDNPRNGNSIEMAYGTKGGTVRVLIQHPETVGHGPQLFQTFKVHLGSISSVMLSEKFLISTCSKMHVRSWTLTRFRGLISTQPGSTPHASFSCVQMPRESEGDLSSQHSLTPFVRRILQLRGNDSLPGPFGDQEDGDKQVLIQRMRSLTSEVNVIVASNGNRICSLESVDSSPVTTVCVHECEAVAMGSRSRRYILTGHLNGHVQVWDLTTGFEKLLGNHPTQVSSNNNSSSTNGPSFKPQDLMRQLL